MRNHLAIHPNVEGNAISCIGLSRTYGEVQALKNLNLTVPYGSIFGFLGRNGAGKTTTIRILTGLAQPSAGSAWVAGVEATRSNSVARQHFGYLPQAPAFYRWMTPVEYLDYVAHLYGLSQKERKQRIAEVLQLVDLKSAAGRRIGGFSGGMIQRLGIAQALVHHPQVLILDEPTSALDPAGRYEVLELIESLRGQVTVFFSTHILSDVERVCDHVTIIDRGRKLLDAETSDLLTRYAMEQYIITVRPEDHSRAARLIGQNCYVSQVTPHLNQLHVVSKPGQSLEMGEKLLFELIRQGIVVREFMPNRTNLEDAFFRVIEEHHLAEQTK